MKIYWELWCLFNEVLLLLWNLSISDNIPCPKVADIPDIKCKRWELFEQAGVIIRSAWSCWGLFLMFVRVDIMYSQG